MAKRITISLFCMLFSYSLGFSQTIPLRDMKTPSIGIKSNLLYDALTNINLGLEFKVSQKHTLDISANYNPWTFSDNKKFKHILIQPELRYWLCEPYNGHFLGIHAHYAYYNVGGIKLPLDIYRQLEDYRYQGWLVGGGISYGYQWYIHPRWNIEATVGLGYFYSEYDKYECHECGEHIGDNHKHYIGPTKVGISLIYLIR